MSLGFLEYLNTVFTGGSLDYVLTGAPDVATGEQLLEFRKYINERFPGDVTTFQPASGSVGVNGVALSPAVLQAIKELRESGYLFGFDSRLLEDAEKRTRNNRRVIEDPYDNTLVGKMVLDPDEEAEDQVMELEGDDLDDEDDRSREQIVAEAQMREEARSRMRLRVEPPIVRPEMARKEKDREADPYILPQTRQLREQITEERRRAREKKGGKPDGDSHNVT